MAARVEAQREQEDDRPMTASTTPQRRDEGGRKEISLTAFRVMFPGMVSSTEA